MAKQPKFDTDALIEFLKSKGVSHARAHAQAHKMATEHACSEEQVDAKDDKLRAEMKVMNAQTIQETFDKFDNRTTKIIQNANQDQLEMYKHFDQRTENMTKESAEASEDIKLEMQEIRHKIEDTRKDIQNTRIKLLIQLSGVIVGTAVVGGFILEIAHYFLH